MFKLQNKKASQCLKLGDLRLFTVLALIISVMSVVALGVDVSVTNHPATLQEKAYSSPIWYTP